MKYITKYFFSSTNFKAICLWSDIWTDRPSRNERPNITVGKNLPDRI